MKYGIVSTASIVPRFIEAIRHSDSEITAIYSRSIAKAMDYATKYGIKSAYDDKDAFLDSDIDVVYIASINSDHYPWIKRSLLKGKHVLCEKPMVLKAEEVSEVFTLAKERHLLLMEANKSLFLPITTKLKSIIDDSSYGKLLSVDMASSWSKPSKWMYEKEGGVLNRRGTYIYEYLQYLINAKDVSFTAHGRIIQDAIVEATINFDMDGIKVFNNSNMEEVKLNRAIFNFEKAVIEVPSWHKATKMLINNEAIEMPCAYELVYEIKHFETCAQEGLSESPIMSEKLTYDCAKFVEDANMKIFSENEIHA